ncbi:hypothetical protein DFH27DRAFT_623203 [Peziza echinospora]|nr:hypothetical protein DFH27DRAFT_623203 [Peziza echinospora]
MASRKDSPSFNLDPQDINDPPDKGIPKSTLDGKYWRSESARPPPKRAPTVPGAPHKPRQTRPSRNQLEESREDSVFKPDFSSTPAQQERYPKSSLISNTSSDLSSLSSISFDDSTPKVRKALTWATETFVPKLPPGTSVQGIASNTLDLIAGSITHATEALSDILEGDEDRTQQHNPSSDNLPDQFTTFREGEEWLSSSQELSPPRPTRSKMSAVAPSNRGSADLDTAAELAALKAEYAVLKAQLATLTSAQSSADKAKQIENDIERRRREAYEAANLPYPGPATSPERNDRRSVGIADDNRRISHKSIGYLRPGAYSARSWEATDNDVYVRPMAWLNKLKSRLECHDDMAWKAKVMEIAAECLQGRAASWWTAIGDRMRTLLRTDYTLELWKTHIQVLCPSKEQMRKDAYERKWDQSHESCLDYVWDKAAMFNELDESSKLSPAALIAEILDGLPVSLAQQSRTEFDARPSVENLCHELQILVPRWERSQSALSPLVNTNIRSTKTYSTRSRTEKERTIRARDPVDPPLSSTLDKSKIAMKEHPVLKKIMRSYTKPNGRVIYLERPCKKCGKEHFDFEHESPKVMFAVNVDEFGYDEYEDLNEFDSASDSDRLN